MKFAGENMKLSKWCIGGIFMIISITVFSSTYSHTPGKKDLMKKLTPIQYKVTQEKGTEPPFNNAYWNNEAPGIYVDIISGKPLFSSLDKFDSGTGWPSFTKPLEPENIVLQQDKSDLMTRTEVVATQSQSHLGHVFDDGPPPAHKRFCMNSAALEFIPVKDLEKRGYGKYLSLFKNKSTEPHHKGNSD